MKKLIVLVALAAMATTTRAQNVNCATAVNQLQVYANEVNRIYH